MLLETLLEKFLLPRYNKYFPCKGFNNLKNIMIRDINYRLLSKMVF